MNCLKQSLTADSFSRQEELTFRDCDARGRARLGTLLSLLVITAGHDFDARNLGYERLLALHQVFLLSRLSLQIDRCPTEGERVTVDTWEDGARAAHVRRGYEMTGSDGGVCLSARSEWIIVDPRERKILRPAQFTAAPITASARVISCPECRKILLPAEAAALGEHRVAYSDLDCNGHVFSGRYGDILWDVLPPELQGADLRRFAINYSKEATLGETLELRGLCRDNTLLAGGLCGGEHCFTCACEFAG